MESQPITKEDPPLTRKIKKHFAWKKEQETQALGKKAQGPGKRKKKPQTSCKSRAIELALIAETPPMFIMRSMIILQSQASILQSQTSILQSKFSLTQIRENPIRNMDYHLREMKNSITFAVEIITINILQT